MKILPILSMAAALALCSCATNPRGAYVAPSTIPVVTRVNAASGKITQAQGSVTKAQAHVVKAKAAVAKIETIVPKTSENAELILSLKQEIDGLTDELLNTQAALKEAQTELTQATTVDIPKLQKNVETQTGLLNTAVTQRDQFQRERDEAVGKYHKLKFWIIGVAAAAVGFLLWSIFSAAMFAPPILWLTLGAEAAVVTFLTFYL